MAGSLQAAHGTRRVPSILWLRTWPGAWLPPTMPNRPCLCRRWRVCAGRHRHRDPAHQWLRDHIAASASR